MLPVLVLSVSTLLQATAATLALLLIRPSGKRLSWILLALALVLMGLRRSITLAAVLEGRRTADLRAELVALMISVLACLAVAGLRQLFRQIRETEERLRSERALNAEILDHLPLNVFLKDERGRVRFMNRSALELLGRDPGEVLGKTDFDFFPDEIARNLREVDEQAVAAGRPILREEKLLVDGRPRDFLAGKAPLRVAGYEEPHLLGFSVEISDLKRAEEALRRSETRFRELVENMSSGVVVYEAVEGGRDFVIRDFNRAAERIERLPRGEALGRSAQEVFPGLEAFGLLAALRRVGSTGEPERLPAAEYEDERIRGWREAFVYRLPGGEVVAVYDDVTESKRLESEYVQAQKLEAVGRLAGGIAHDFNNLLQVVLGNTELLSLEAGNRPPVDDRLREIRQHVVRGSHLCRQLLAFSRRQESRPERLDLRSVVEGAGSLLRRLVRESIDLEILLPDEPLPVRADRGQLEQVIMNLALNASDAMPEGGGMALRAGAEGEREVWLEVEDEGPGVPESIRGRLFEPFFTTKGEGEGTGLGLAVVHGIVSQHGGRVEVRSRPGEGAIFRALLPRAAEESAGGAEAAGSAAGVPRGGGERVLLVEDQAAARNTLTAMLASLGYRVVAVAGGAEADRLPDDARFDVLVTDLGLQDTTGTTLAERLRRRWPGLRVVLISGYPGREAALDRGALEGARFLQKPFDRATLAGELRRVLDAR